MQLSWLKLAFALKLSARLYGVASDSFARERQTRVTSIKFKGLCSKHGYRTGGIENERKYTNGKRYFRADKTNTLHV